MIARTPPGHESGGRPESGLGWGLSHEAFEAWWYGSLLPEDAAEYVHLHGGNSDGARFVCALHHLTSVERRAQTSDLIVRAYLIAKNDPSGDMQAARVRYEAQEVFDRPAVQALLDRVRYRTGRALEERIKARTGRKIEALYDRTAEAPPLPQPGDEDGEAIYAEHLATEKVALDASIRFLGVEQRRESADAARRDKHAVAEAMRSSQERQLDAARVPSLDEAKHFFEMLCAEHGRESIVALVKDIALGSPDEAETGRTD